MKLKHIAEHFNVSIVTISKVINSKEGVSEDLREKIIEYLIQNNIPLKNSNENISNNINIIIPEYYCDKTAGFYQYYLKCLIMELNNENYLASVSVVSQEQIDKRIINQTLKGNDILGFLLLGQIESGYIKEIKKLKKPMVLVDFYDTNLDIPSVTANNFVNSYNLTNYLCMMGHTNIGFIGNIYSTASIRDRYLGYEKSLIEHNIIPNHNWIIYDSYLVDTNIQDFTLPKDMPTAFVSNCDQTACTFIAYLKQNNINVPEQCSVVAFDNTIYTELSNPNITTMAIDIVKTSKEAISLLKSIIINPSKKVNNILIDGKLIVNKSVKKIYTYN